MDVRQLADLGPTAPLASSRYIHDLSEALEKVLEGTGAFTHTTEVHGGMGTIKLFLQGPLKESTELEKEEATPFRIATSLVASAQEGARYSDNPPKGRVKGWSIRAVKIGPKMAAIAEAVWV